MRTIIQKIRWKCNSWTHGALERASGALKASLRASDDTLLQDIARAWIVLSVALLAFGVGLLFQIESAPKSTLDTHGRVPYLSQFSPTHGSHHVPQNAEGTGKSLVASKRGKKYHYVWCAGARTIAENNRRYFSTPQEAEQAGYTAASNCPGL